MKKNTDNYDLAHPSVSGKPGFDLFQDQKSGEYFFHFNDASGEPLLYSEGYMNSDGRNKGVRSVVANSADRKRYKIKKEKNSFFLTLTAKNHKEIARSKVFSDKVSLEEAMQYLQNNVSSVNDLFDPVVQKLKEKTVNITKAVKAKKATEKSKKGTISQMPAPKYFFKIDLYPHNGNNMISGKISSAINEESLKFKGLDMEAIAGFIKSQVPADMLDSAADVLPEAPRKLVDKSREAISAMNVPKASKNDVEINPVVVVKSDDVKMLQGKVK